MSGDKVSESGEDSVGVSDANAAAQKEYELAVKTQMHFNEILMKFRSFGVSVVIAIFSYALTRPATDVVLPIGLAPSQVIAVAGIVLCAVLAVIDIWYFFPLLLGAVKRAIALEGAVPFRLTSTISETVSEGRARGLLILFYVIVGACGVILVWWVLPKA